MYDNKSIIILGLGPQGLALLRTYSKAGYHVIAVGLKDDVGIYSRYGDKHIIGSYQEFIEISKNNLSGDEIVHITSDYFLNYIMDNNPDFFDN